MDFGCLSFYVLLSCLYLSESASTNEGTESTQITLTSENANGIIKSPGFGEQKTYDHNADVTWTINAPENYHIELKFETLEIKNPFGGCRKDYIEVFTNLPTSEASEKYCTNNKPSVDVIKSTGNIMKLHFVSDRFFTNEKGFLAKYSMIDDDGKYLVTLPTTTEDPDYYDDYYEETTPTQKRPSTATTVSSTTTTTQKPTTTTTTTTTQKTTTTTTTQKPTTSKSTTTLLSKIITSAAVDKEVNKSLPGYVITAIIGFIAIICAVILLVIFLRWRKQRRTRFISLRENSIDDISTSDTKKLVNNGQQPVIYKKGSKFTRIPQQETFPL